MLRTITSRFDKSLILMTAIFVGCSSESPTTTDPIQTDNPTASSVNVPGANDTATTNDRVGTDDTGAFEKSSVSEGSTVDLKSAFRKIQLDYQQQMRSLREKLTAAGTAAERQEIMANGPNVSDAVSSAIALFEGNESDDFYPRMASWVLRTTDDEDAAQAVIDKSLQYHSDHNDLPMLLQTASGSSLRSAAKFIDNLAATETANGMLARYIQAEQLNAESDSERKIQMLNSIIQYDGELNFGGADLHELAEGQLFALTRLQIGQEVPEIEGEDIEGVNFKLSEYRGKVVMLDFWGNW